MLLVEFRDLTWHPKWYFTGFLKFWGAARIPKPPICRWGCLLVDERGSAELLMIAACLDLLGEGGPQTHTRTHLFRYGQPFEDVR